VLLAKGAAFAAQHVLHCQQGHSIVRALSGVLGLLDGATPFGKSFGAPVLPKPACAPRCARIGTLMLLRAACDLPPCTRADRSPAMPVRANTLCIVPAVLPYVPSRYLTSARCPGNLRFRIAFGVQLSIGQFPRPPGPPRQVFMRSRCALNHCAADIQIARSDCQEGQLRGEEASRGTASILASVREGKHHAHLPCDVVAPMM
jgi:hypothetical protein